MSNLKSIKPQADQSVIEQLEHILEYAKEGKIIEFYLCARFEKGQVLNSSAGNKDDVYGMFGLMMSAAADYKSEHIE